MTEGRIYVVLGSRILETVVADCIHAVRTGAVPRPEPNGSLTGVEARVWRQVASWIGA